LVIERKIARLLCNVHMRCPSGKVCCRGRIDRSRQCTHQTGIGTGPWFRLGGRPSRAFVKSSPGSEAATSYRCRLGKNCACRATGATPSHACRESASKYLLRRGVVGDARRMRAGLAHARQNGERIGRPATAAMHTIEVPKLLRSGLSKSKIRRRLNIGRTSVRRTPACQTNQ